MPVNFKQRFDSFIKNDKDYPLLVGFISGLYPMVFYFSNNYEAVNSLKHFLFFSGLFLILPTIAAFVAYRIFENIPKLAPYKKHLLFIFLIMVMAAFLSQGYYMTLKKKALLALLIPTVLLSLKYSTEYKRLLAFASILTLIAIGNFVIILYHVQFTHNLNWMDQKDGIENVKFVNKPNIYFIEPDGYTGEYPMKDAVYRYRDTIFDWLRNQKFTVYNNTNSNYPTSLASNASMFAMKHHYFGEHIISPIEIPNARHVIVANNPVVKIFKKNGYKTFFIAEDEYFQKNFQTGLYDFYNIQNSQIPFFSKDDVVKKDVYDDLKKCMLENSDNKQPRFFFVEKLLPHHIHFDGSGIANERKVYLQKIEQTNIWFKKTLDLIHQNDPKAIVIIASDHGGWVGLENYPDFYATTDKKLIHSIYGNLIAIKWNDDSRKQWYENQLKSNVNIFRILFSHLSQDEQLLENIEDNSAFNYHQSLFSGKAVKVIDNK